jgi:hypothetical protein
MFRASPGTDFFFFYLPQFACLLSARGVESKFEVCLLGEQASSLPSFRSAFAPRGIPSPEFRAWCKGTTSSLAFRPAFPPGRITPPEFRAFCKHGSSIVACFPTGISSRKNHSSGIPSFVQARELHLRLFFGLHFLQEELHLRNSKLSASTGAPSPLAFRPAFPPGSITSPEFKTYCKRGNFVPASDFVRKPQHICKRGLVHTVHHIQLFSLPNMGFFLTIHPSVLSAINEQSPNFDKSLRTLTR